MGDWRDHASCFGEDPEKFFPAERNQDAEARKICEDCSVAEDCLLYAYTTKQQYGVWGGVTLRMKRMMKGQYNAQLKRLKELQG